MRVPRREGESDGIGGREGERGREVDLRFAAARRFGVAASSSSSYGGRRRTARALAILEDELAERDLLAAQAMAADGGEEGDELLDAGEAIQDGGNGGGADGGEEAEGESAGGGVESDVGMIGGGGEEGDVGDGEAEAGEDEGGEGSAVEGEAEDAEADEGVAPGGLGQGGGGVTDEEVGDAEVGGGVARGDLGVGDGEGGEVVVVGVVGEDGGREGFDFAEVGVGGGDDEGGGGGGGGGDAEGVLDALVQVEDCVEGVVRALRVLECDEPPAVAGHAGCGTDRPELVPGEGLEEGEAHGVGAEEPLGGLLVGG